MLFHSTSIIFKIFDGLSFSHIKNNSSHTVSLISKPPYFIHFSLVTRFKSNTWTLGIHHFPTLSLFRRALTRYHFSSQHWILSLPCSRALHFCTLLFLTLVQKSTFGTQNTHGVWGNGTEHVYHALTLTHKNHALITFEKGRWRWKNKFSMVFGLLKHKINRKNQTKKMISQRAKECNVNCLTYPYNLWK